LANGTGDPTLQGLGGELALRACAPEAHFDCVALNADQLNRTVMKLLNICADLFDQGSNVFFTRVIGGNVFSHDELLKADGSILSCLNRKLVYHEKRRSARQSARQGIESIDCLDFDK
jgi:hypothetical protein